MSTYDGIFSPLSHTDDAGCVTIVANNDDYVTFRNGQADWTIFKRFATGIGGGYYSPGVISKVVDKKGNVICDDGYGPLGAETANDVVHLQAPTHGGLGAVGFHAARKNSEFQAWLAPNYDRKNDPKGHLGNCTWDVTTRYGLDHGIPGNTFGVVAITINNEPSVSSCVGHFSITVTLGENGNQSMDVIYGYTIYNTQVKQQVVAALKPGAAGLYIKEPKVVLNSLLDYHTLDILSYVTGKPCLANGKAIDMTNLPDPRCGTRQIGAQQRGTAVFSAQGLPTLQVKSDAMQADWDNWADDADAADQLTSLVCPRYCLKGPNQTLTRQWECAHFPAGPQKNPNCRSYPTEQTRRAGLMLHSWEGGFGTTDCLCAFRAVNTSAAYTMNLTYSFGDPGAPPPPPGPPPPPPSSVRWDSSKAYWTRKHAYVLYGMRTRDNTGPVSTNFTPAQLTAIAQQMGFGSLAIQGLGSDDPDWQAHFIAVKPLLNAVGIKAMVWCRVDGTYTFTQIQNMINAINPDAFLADVEVTGWGQDAFITAFDAAFPNLPRALIATGGGIDGPDTAAPWITNWDVCFQDYYLHGGTRDEGLTPNGNVTGGNETYAINIGWSKNCVGFYHTPVLEIISEDSGPAANQLADKLAGVPQYGPHMGFYPLETILGDGASVQAITNLR